MQGNITDWGKEVKKGLIERDWSINDLAERIGKSRTRVSGVVNGRIYSDSIASEGTCRQCGRRILWVRMKSGKNMPVDMALHNYKKDSTGKEKIVTPDGEVVAGRILVGERGDGAGYISHFASCKKYRR